MAGKANGKIIMFLTYHFNESYTYDKRIRKRNNTPIQLHDQLKKIATIILLYQKYYKSFQLRFLKLSNLKDKNILQTFHFYF